MNVTRVFSSKFRTFFFNFEKSAGEISLLPPSTSYVLFIKTIITQMLQNLNVTPNSKTDKKGRTQKGQKTSFS